MEKIGFQDITTAERTPLASLQNLICVGDAEWDEQGRVVVHENGGVKTECFTSPSDNVAVSVTCRAEKPLTIRIGYVKRGGTICFEGIHSFTVSPKADGVVRLNKNFDASSLAVYYDAISFFVQIDASEQNLFEVVDGRIWNHSELENMDIYAENLEKMLMRIEQKMAQMEYRSSANAENIAVSPSGNRFIVHVDDDGCVSATPVVPNKVLFVGNSLLLGMSMTYGMCATSPRTDFYSQVCAAIRQKNPDVVFTRAHGARFEQLEDATRLDELWLEAPNPYTKRPLCESFTEDLDLIIFQLGTNVNNHERAVTLEKTIDPFLSYVKKSSPRARIVWMHGWGNEHLSGKTIVDACRRWGVGQFSIKDLRTKENEAHIGQEYELPNGEKQVVDEFWIEHPGDFGMKRIADRLIDFLRI